MAVLKTALNFHPKSAERTRIRKRGMRTWSILRTVTADSPIINGSVII